MNKILKTAYTVLFVSVCIVSAPISGWSQTQTTGSTSSQNTSRYIGYSQVTDAESLFIGPNANITIASGATWDIYSKNVWISPSATIIGPGTIVLHNSADISGVDGPTLIDGNDGNYITANIKVVNNKGVYLQNITLPSDLGGWTTSTTSTLKLGATLDLAVNGANVYLGGVLPSDATSGYAGDLNFNSSGAFVTTGGSLGTQRMVITNNSSLSHVVKTQSPSSTFVYPVGIAAGDYTPATITASTTEHVSVVDYTQRTNYPVINVPEEGMDRTWHVYGGASSSITLVHNTTTNGTLYTDNQAFITRYAGGAQWSYTGTIDYISPGIHTNTGTIASGMPSSGSSDASWLTKASDRSSPLPVKFASFTVSKVNNQAVLNWSTATEINNGGFTIQRSSNGTDWEVIGTKASNVVGGNTTLPQDYTFTDVSPMSGINYYRIKQTDLDNVNITYSEVRDVTFTLSGDIKVYPNPALSYVKVENAPVGAQLRLISMDGKVYQSVIVNKTVQEINVSNLPSAMYFIQIVKDNKVVGTLKFIKK